MTLVEPLIYAPKYTYRHLFREDARRRNNKTCITTTVLRDINHRINPSRGLCYTLGIYNIIKKNNAYVYNYNIIIIDTRRTRSLLRGALSTVLVVAGRHSIPEG